MCGFVGVWQRNGMVDRERVIAMRDTLTHRGPDDGGLWMSPSGHAALGFRRLSIIDLSDASNQPLSDSGGNAWIVFNGEVFNYASVRESLLERGCTFRSNGDAEVVLQAYLQYGERCLDLFQGMFAFVIWDERTQRIWMARDRMGIKPLYYYLSPGVLAFASEPKALLEHPSVDRKVSSDALRDYLTYGYVPHDKAIFEGVKKLPAGHHASFDGTVMSVKKYWSAEYNPLERSEEEVVDELRTMLSNSVNLWMTSDVPVGMFLSGGLDSSSVCSVVHAQANEKLRTYAIGFDYERQNELAYALQVSQTFGTDHHERIVGVEDARNVLDTLSRVYDEPLYDTSSVPTYYVSKFAAEHNKVVLTGDGGDEVLFGYYWYQNFLRLNKPSVRNTRFVGAMSDAVVQVMRPIPKAARIAALTPHTTSDPVRRYFGLIGFFDGWEQRKLLGESALSVMDDPLWLYRKFYRDDLPANVALRLLDVNTFLVDDILTKVDRASMANSLEARTPMLEHRFVEFAFSIPERYVFRNNEKKYLLKKAMEGILPNDIIYRKKRGFSAPVASWLQGDLREFANERLLNGFAVRDGLFNPKAISAMIGNYTKNRWAKLWQLLTFEGWYRRWICKSN